MTEYNFDVQSMVDEIPKKFNRSNHRPKDGNGIPLEWLDLFPTTKNPQIPNNLLTSIKQAIETPEWKSLGLFYTKRGKVSEFHSKFTDIVAVLLQYIPLLSIPDQSILYHRCSQNDMDFNKFINYLEQRSTSNKSTMHIPYTKEYTINHILSTLSIPDQSILYHRCSQNDMELEDEEVFDGYKALSISSVLNDDYKIDKPFADKIITALITPYTINGNQHQILYRKPNPAFTETSKKSRWLYGFDSFFRTKKIQYTFKYTNIENHYVKYQHKKILQMGDYKLLTSEYRNYLLIKYPTRGEYHEYLQTIIGAESKGYTITTEALHPRKKKANKYKKIDYSNGYIYVEDLIDNGDYYIYKTDAPRTVYFGLDYFRHYSPYNMSNCILRSRITYKGFGLDQCDVSSMYPVILLQAYDKRFRDTNDTIEHERILAVITAENPRDVFMSWCKQLGISITKQEMKTENLSYYNKKASHAIRMKIHKMYEQMLPGFAEWLIQLKVRTQAGHKGYWQHKFVSRWLEWKESTIMDHVLMQCEDAGILFQGIHDGIDVEHGKGDQVAQWIKQSMHDNGYICNVTVTYGEKK